MLRSVGGSARSCFGDVMDFLGWCAIYLAAHLVLYFLVFRHLAAFATERVIFLYHAVSAVAVSLVAAVAWLIPGTGVDIFAVVAAIALHGVYSITMLEVWSLAEGGYSLQIFAHFAEAERAGRPVDVEVLQAIGTSKQSNRLEGLMGAGLIRQDGTRIQLTTVGTLLASFLAAIAWLTGVRDGI
jgi:hypothetical protein